MAVTRIPEGNRYDPQGYWEAKPDFSGWEKNYENMQKAHQEMEAWARRRDAWLKKQAQQAATDAARQQQMGEQLNQLTGLQNTAFDRLTSGFKQASETAASQQLGGVLRGVGQMAARRGITGSGIAGGAEAQVRGQLAGQALQAQLGFRGRLSELHDQARQGFILGKFDFFEAMDMQINQQEFDEHMARLNRKWELDDQARQQYWDFAQGLGGGIIDYATGKGWL